MDELHAGEVGWLSASIRAVADARVGDTITLKGKQGAQHALPGTLLVPVGPRLVPIGSCLCLDAQKLLLLLLLPNAARCTGHSRGWKAVAIPTLAICSPLEGRSFWSAHGSGGCFCSAALQCRSAWSSLEELCAEARQLKSRLPSGRSSIAGACMRPRSCCISASAAMEHPLALHRLLLLLLSLIPGKLLASCRRTAACSLWHLLGCHVCLPHAALGQICHMYLRMCWCRIC